MKLTPTEYRLIHRWMDQHYPRVGRCEYCGRLGKTERASASHGYTTNPADWFEFCPRCHHRFDVVDMAARAQGPKSPEWRAALSVAMKGKTAAARKRSPLTADDVIEIRRAHAAGEASYAELARRYGVRRSTIWGVLQRRTWKEL